MAKRQKIPDKVLAKTLLKRPQPPSIDDITNDIKAMDDSDILFTRELDLSASYPDDPALLVNPEVQQNYENVVRFISLHSHLRSASTKLQVEYELTTQVGNQLSETLADLKNKARTNPEGES